MSKKAKHHKPKGPKSPPQNLVPQETEEIKSVEPEKRVPDPKPNLPSPAVDTKAATSEVKPIDKTEQCASNPAVEAPDITPTPVKPKRHRGNRKKKHVDGGAQEVTEEEARDTSANTTTTEENVESKQAAVQTPPPKISEIKEVKEDVQVTDRSKKNAKQKKGGNKGEVINQEKISADTSISEVKKSDEKVLEKKCDAQTQVEPKGPKDVKNQEKEKDDDGKIITDNNFKKNVSDTENKPEKSKRGKNKKKESKEDITEKSINVPEEKIKSADLVILSEIAQTGIKENIKKCSRENIPACLLDEKKDISKDANVIPAKSDIKPDQKNKKDKKQKDKEILAKNDETNILPSPIIEPKTEDKNIPSQVLPTLLKTDKEKPVSGDAISETKSKISIEDDIYPTLASSIEETLQKLIVCESDLILAEKMYSDDKTPPSESVKIEPISTHTKEMKEQQKSSEHQVSKEKGKDKNKKSKKSEKQSENSPNSPEVHILPDVSVITQPIQLMHLENTGKQNENMKCEIKPKEEKLSSPQCSLPSQPSLNLQKKPSPGQSLSESVDKTFDCLEKNFQYFLGSAQTEQTPLASAIIQSPPPSLCIKKGSSPTILQQLFQPIIEPIIENVGKVEEIKYPLAEMPADIKLVPSPVLLPTPEIRNQKEPSPGRSLRDPLLEVTTECQGKKDATEQKAQGLLEFKAIETKPISSNTVQSCPLNLCLQTESSPTVSLIDQLQPAEKASKIEEKHLPIIETKKDSIPLPSVSQNLPDLKNVSSPTILQENLLDRIISKEKPEKSQADIQPVSRVIASTVPEDIINMLLTDTPPAFVNQPTKMPESCQIGNISKSHEDLLKFDTQKPIEKQEEKSALDSTKKELLQNVEKMEECKTADGKHKKNIKSTSSPAKDLQDKVDEDKNAEKTEKNKNQKNKSKNQDKNKSETAVIVPEVTEKTEASLTQFEIITPVDTKPPDNTTKNQDDKFKDIQETESASEAFVKLEDFPANIPKPAKRAKDKKNKGRGHDLVAESENIPIVSDTKTPVSEITEDIKNVISNKTKEVDIKTSHVKPQLNIGKSDNKDMKLGETSKQSPQPDKSAIDPTGSTFEFLKIPDDKEEEKPPSKEGIKPQAKSPTNQSKNLHGPSSSPAKSNKYDYKKEKNKDPKTASSDSAPVNIKDELEKEVKSTTPMPKKNNKAKNKASNEQKTNIQEKKDTQTLGVISGTLVPKSSTSDLTEDMDEEFVYKYSFRTVFIANACHICKVQLRDDRVVCRFCHLVSYCNENHRDDDWSEHQTLCYAICTLSHVKASEHIYGDAKSLSGQDYRLLRMQAIVSCEKILKRKLCPWEQEVLLYPRICSDPSCREWKSNNLKDCDHCGQVSYCTKNQAHLPQDHSAWCQSYRLYHRLVAHQLHQGRIEPDLPTKIYKDGYQLSEDCSRLFEDLYGQFKDIDDCHYATLTQLSTAPLTALYAYQKTIGAKDSATDVSKKESLCLHVIGAELQFEADTLNKWECFFLHLAAGLQELRIVFIGPELNSSKLPVDLLSRVRMCQACRQTNRTVKFEFHDGMLYHDFVESSKFSKPDLICAFNPGFHRATGYAGLDTWPETISASLRLKAPLCVTAYTQYEMPRDLARVKTVFPDVQVKIAPARNPYASLRPDRNFISDDEMPLIFKNYQMMIVSAV